MPRHYTNSTMFFIPSDRRKDGNIKLKEICDRLGYVDIADFVKLKKIFFCGLFRKAI